MKRLLRAKALLIVLLALAGCRVDGAVDVTIRGDGTGVVAVSVALDDEALGRLGDPAAQLRLDDLRAAGWNVEAPKKERDNKTYFRVAKPFSSAEQFAVVMNEVTGPTGFLQSFAFRQTSSFAKVTTEVVGRIDPSQGLSAFSDADVAAALGGNPLGRPDADVQKDSANTSLVLRISVPGSVKGQADRTSGSTAQWTIAPGQPPREVVLRATNVRNKPRLLTALAVGLGAFALVALVAALTRRRPVPPPPTARAALPPAVTATSTRPRLRAVVLDAMGVLFRDGDDVGAHLIPFVAGKGGSTDEGQVREVYRQASLGTLSSAELWERLGVAGDPDDLDDEYVQRFTLNDGVEEFLDAMARRGVAIACVTNDVAEWSELLRYRFDLVDRIDPWVVSGQIGARKPDTAIFAAVRRALDLPYAACLLVDDRPTNLDAARSLGMATALFTPVRLTDVDHRQIRNLTDLLGRKRAAASSGPGGDEPAGTATS